MSPDAATSRRPPLWAVMALLVAVTFPLWYGGMRLRGGSGLLDHSPIDQHTRQARAWLAGRVDLISAPAYLEIAEYQGRYFNSFPPTPAVFEVPLVLAFGRETPSSLLLYVFWVVALAVQYAALVRVGFPWRDALLGSLAFIFGTNVFVSCVRANVWAQGQSLGYCLAVIGVCLVLHNRRRNLLGPALGYVFLSLAVGCRPLMLLYAPVLVALDWRTSGRRPAWAAATGALAMLPYGALLAWYNHVRFGSVAEFGHNHLPWAKKLPTGLFDVAYLPRNLYHGLLRMPEWTGGWPPVFFDPWGTAFYLNNGILLVGLLGLFRRRVDPVVRATAAAALFVIAAGIFTYEAGGWRQFGYRYILDLLPGAFALYALAYRRFDRWMALAFASSFLVNLYGIAAWKELPRPR
ncbi:MAG TPA: hypothetical protein VFM29_03845 [Vicinamibacteria bacterium]|nr:hypothetical protein [Vicinamibacteria bacterium]